MFKRASGIFKIVPLVVIVTSMGACSTIEQGSIPEPRRRITSWNYLKWQNVDRQSFDYSCGAAALATLIAYYFEEPVTEGAILMGVLSSLPKDEILDREKKGLSLLDLKNQAQRMGFIAVGVRIDQKALHKLKGPVLVLLKDSGLDHFTVLKGLRSNRAYFADPARGNFRMPMVRFLDEWDGSVLVLGKKDFGLPLEHGLAIPMTEEVRPEVNTARQMMFR